jgi:HD-GYP domain-containing protein (c-di-GMP phosphodiesterase class II)
MAWDCAARRGTVPPNVAAVRSLEVLGALSRATDLGTGLPDEHALRTAAIAARLASLAGGDQAEADVARRVGLLHSAGCTTDAHEAALVYGEDLEFRADYARVDGGRQLEVLAFLLRRLGRGLPAPRRAIAVARLLPGAQARATEALAGHCEVAARLAERLGCGAAERAALDFVFERWDGKGFPAGVKGEAIPPVARLLHVARDLDVFSIGGVAGAVEVLRKRAGTAYEPGLAVLAADSAEALCADLEDPWEAAVGVPGAADSSLADEQLDSALGAVADFADLKTPFTHGHSPAVSELAEAAAWRCGLAVDEVDELRRAGLVHDLGRVGVGNDVWEHRGPLSGAQRERVRMYPYWGERALGRSADLAAIGRAAAGHSERVDGSGYYRGLRGTELGTRERLLAAADVFVALSEQRPHRAALERAAAVDVMRGDVAGGRLDADAAEAVLAAAGERTPGRLAAGLPADLTPREAEVLRLLARGLTNKEIAARLEISPKTIGNHIERVYAKAGVRTRAAATLFAVEHGIAGSQR